MYNVLRNVTMTQRIVMYIELLGELIAQYINDTMIVFDFLYL